MNLPRNMLVASSLAFALSVNLFAQEVYTIQNKTLKEALEIISKKSNLSYVANDKLLESKKTYSIKNIEGVQNAIKEVLKGSNLEAIIKNNTIVIKRKKVKNISKNSNNLGEIDVLGNEESAYGKVDGYVASKSSTGSKMDMDISEIPQSVSVITKDFMDVRNAQTIQNALAYSSAISQPSGENGDTRYNYARLRGGPNLYNSTFVDGMKLAHYSLAIPKTESYAFERVEILKGPSSVLYGASSPGGLLNLQTKRANNNEDKEIELLAGSNNTYNLAFDVNHPLNEDVFLRLTGKYKESGDKPSAFDQDKSYLFNPALKYNISDNTTLDILASFYKDELPASKASDAGGLKFTLFDEIIKNKDGLAGLLALQGFPLPASNIEAAAQKANNVSISEDFYLGHENETSDRDSISFTSLLNHKFNENTQINSAFRYYKLDGEYIYNTLDANALGAFLLSQNYTTIPLSQDKYSFDLESISLDTNLQHKWELAKVQNSSMLGVDFYSHDATSKNYTPVSYSFDIINPNYKQNIASHNSLRSNRKNKLKQLGVYAQNQAKINEKIILSTALRYDKVKEDNSDSVTNSSSSQDDNNVSGRIGLAYAFDNGLTPYISYATSFTTNAGSSKDGKKFEPSVGKQIELGAKYRLDSLDGYLTTAIYKIEEKDILTTDPSDSSFNTQEADSEVKGFELDLAIKPIDNMNLVLSYTKLDTKQKNKVNSDLDGLKLDRIPGSGFSIWSDYTIPNTSIGDFKFGAGAKYVGKSQQLVKETLNVAQGQPTKMRDLDSYTLVDAMLGTKYNNMDFTFSVANLFDERAELNPQVEAISLTQGRTYTFRFKYTF